MFSVKPRYDQFDVVDDIKVGRPDVLRRVARSAHECMARMFEHRSLVQYVALSAEMAALSGARFGFEGKVDPEIIARIFGRLDEYVEVR